MSEAMVIMRDEEGQLPTCHELRLAGFTVSAAVATKQENSEKEIKESKTEKTPSPTLLSG